TGGSPSHQLLNESQMVLHSHAVNEAREARGEPAVNSVWFWGGGRAPRVATKHWHSVSADEPLALGLARAAAMRYRTLPGSATAWLDRAPEDGRHLIVLDALRAPLALSVTGEYQQASALLERDWVASVLSVLRDVRVGWLSLEETVA